MPPLLIIGMPVYNSEAYIREAIDSLLSQTFSNFQLIISDNASTDSTGAICKEYVQLDQRIRYIRQDKNIGAAANYRYVLQAADVCKYFMWAAGDDTWSQDWVESLIDEFNETDVGLFGCYREGGGLTIQPPTYRKGEYFQFFLDSDKTGKCLFTYSIFLQSFLFKSNKNYFDCPVGSDQVYLLHLLSFGSLRSISAGCLNYRIHDASLSVQQQSARNRLQTVFSRFPFVYYVLAYQAVPVHFRIVMPALIFYKYLKEQVPLFIGLVHSVIRCSLRFFK